MAESGGDERTLAFYTREAPVYSDFAAGAEDSKFLTAFADSLQQGARIMDFGCGPAWAANRFREMGFQADGFDGSEGLAAQARDRYGIDVTVGPFEAFDAVGLYDGIWASFCLQHDSREAMPGHLKRLHRAMLAHGKLYVGLMSGEGHERDGHDRLYTYFTETEMRKLLDEAGFDVDSIAYKTGKRYDGSPVDELHIFATRR
ncbi:MAG: methyltransferase domain-containing protein [Pseudomonadota bacterium]